MESRNKKFWYTNQVEIFIIILGVVIYSIVYSYITVAKYNAYNATIFDLGFNANLLYSVFHGGVSLNPSSLYFINTGKMIYLVLAPFYNIYPHEQVLLIFQSVWIALGSIPLYFLARKKLGDGLVSVAIGITWLLYYPMAGVNWFDFHFMAMFPTFFLFGIAALEYGRKKLSLIFLILAIISDFLIPLVMILFAITLIYKRRRSKEKVVVDFLVISLIAISVGILLITNITHGLSYTTGYAYNNATNVSIFSSNYDQIALYFLRILLPIGFLSFLAPEYLALLLPFLALVSVSHYRPYVDTMFIQYPSLTAPIVFVAGVAGLQKIKKLKKIPLNTFKTGMRRFATFVLIFNIILALFLTPAGNMVTNSSYDSYVGNSISGTNGIYNTNSQISQQTYDHYINEMISMIPLGSTVLAQNNLPQLSQGNNVIMPAAVLVNGSTVKPDYVLVDPYNSFFSNPVFPSESHSANAMNAFNKLFKSGNYGILAEASGITLLEKGYIGKPIMYIPCQYNYSLKNLKIPSNVEIINYNGIEFLNNISVGTAWYGPYVTLSPGNYFINMTLLSPNYNRNNSLTFQVSSFEYSSSDTTILYSKVVNGTMFHNIKFFNISINIKLSRYFNNVEFRGVNATWASYLSPLDIAVTQTSWNIA